MMVIFFFIRDLKNGGIFCVTFPTSQKVCVWGGGGRREFPVPHGFYAMYVGMHE